MTGNLGVMLLIIVPATCNEVGSLFGNPALCNSRALAYASFCMGVSLSGYYVLKGIFDSKKSRKIPS
ncbi:hypothetical protein MA16_Dca016395 [Dendrobium catenatum]|uniref:Uncharacterized protein n=1 Tax=Dendrobium catenatum TaxID=906689 RepID=A0A2I0VVA4_9ASPA|nr:hypothetical protein MA16_Dca016395 [Dendrobium catenatum]